MAGRRTHGQRAVQHEGAAGISEGTIASPIIILDDDSDVKPRGMSNVSGRVSSQETATPSPPVRGGTCRFRGLALSVIGQLYPDAHFAVHRVGYPKKSDFSPKGSDLAAMNALIDKNAIFRVEMTQCDTPSEPEMPIAWNRRYADGSTLTADEYGRILKLGEPNVGRIIMFSYCTRQTHSWGLVRQVPGRNYTLEDCFDALVVPDEFRREINGFSAKLWTNGAQIPRLYMCKDMHLKAVLTKINNLMRA
ncbi:hypothetical protein VP1G_09556 [Cytospora mali]|uniref:Uncharacterized protein n=1 Tax=Cytospora mali TaxID=578113 RepID=A0A194VEK6_CYTMA|nr:hypothetical protein VP1G_09556 [Valsa mali var. pyri (nom. inval.)]